MIGEVVDLAQYGFMPGKNISDNILLATELIKGYTTKHISPRCMVKVDLKNAYDSIEWSFLASVMAELGFPTKFLTWVMACVSTVSYSVVVNGVPSRPFKAKKGLTQGDPMSPSLFALGMESLSKSLGSLKHIPNFNFHPRCERLGITHLMFVDDLLMFARADSSSVQLLFDAFNKFSCEANLDKSNMYIAGVNDDEKASLQQIMNIPFGTFPFRYLGVPLTTRKLYYAECKAIIDKTIARVQSWAVKKLSYAARLVLVQSVLQGFQLYWCQIFVLPKKVIKEVQRICRTFLWTGLDSNSRKAPVAWDTICLQKVYGGWNIKDMLIWNRAAIAKHYWPLARNKIGYGSNGSMPTM